MAKSSNALKEFVPGSSRGTRSARTLLLQMAMEEEERREMGARIKALREELGYTQPALAKEIPIGLRNYQLWEAGDGGIGWANLTKLAQVLGVSREYLQSGDLAGARTPFDPPEWAGRIEERLAALEDLIRGRVQFDAYATAVMDLARELEARGGTPALPPPSPPDTEQPPDSDEATG